MHYKELDFCNSIFIESACKNVKKIAVIYFGGNLLVVREFQTSISTKTTIYKLKFEKAIPRAPLRLTLTFECIKM